MAGAVTDKAKTGAQSRIFIALPIPEQIVGLTSQAFEQYPHYLEQRMPPEKWHLTLLWLGKVANPKQYYSRLTKPLPQTFLPTVRLTYVGRGRQRDQLWAYAEASQVLLNIRAQIIDRLKKLRFPFEEDPRQQEYLPHITVGRLLKHSRGIGLADTPVPTSFSVREAIVYRSELNSTGSTYYTEGTIPLA